MSVKKPLAIVATAAMVMTGAAFGASAAVAAPEDSNSNVPGANIQTTTSATESSEYNKWHFDPDHAQAVGQAKNGITVPANGDVLIVKGNGNDVDPTADDTTLEALVADLALKASSTDGVTVQIPVRVEVNGEGFNTADGDLWSTLRADADDLSTWTTSKPLAGVAANGSADLATFADVTGIYPIASGFLVQSNPAETLISSFTAGGETTKFYAEPAAAEAGAASAQYVDAAGIRPNEDTYPGWHDGAAAGGSYETVAGEDGATLGLKVTGKAQILNGFDEDANEFQAGALAFANDMTIKATGGAVWSQVPVFYYADGVAEQQFTTLRAEVPASGTFDASTIWTTSKAIAGSNIAANGQATIADFVAAMGQHEVIGYGAFVDTDVTATLTEISFNGATTTFAKAGEEPGGGDGDGDDNEKPKPAVTFTDVNKDSKFSKEINWMATEGITTGIKQDDGTFKYEPKWSVTREAMAAFLYRINATDEEKAAPAPAKSPFADVKPGDKFYKEIAWMGTNKHSTGVKQADGSHKFEPKWSITREAMAAFMYRIEDGAKDKAPTASLFADMKPGDKFYKEINWMGDKKLSTGIKQGDKVIYAPKWNTTREAMAAFLFRADSLK